MPTQAEISLNPSSAKGDLISYDGSSRIRIAAGTNGQILSANSSVSAGIEWKTYGGESPTPTYALIASSQLTASADTITVSNIPQTYQDLYLVFRGQTQSAWSDTSFGIRFNSVTTGNYANVLLGWKNGEGDLPTRQNPGLDSATLANTFGPGTASAGQLFLDTGGASDENAYRTLYIPNYTDTSSTNTYKTGVFTVGSPTRLSSTNYWSMWYGIVVFTKTDGVTGLPEAITSINAYGIENVGSPAFVSGSYIRVYGVRRFGS